MDAFPSLTREDGTPEAAEEIIYPLVKREPPETTSLNNNDTPEATTGLCISFQVRLQTKQDHIPIMLGKYYKTEKTQVERKDNLHPDAYMMFCQ